MSQKNTHSQDPSLKVGNIPQFKEIDLNSEAIVELLSQKGELFRRKIEPVKGVREPETEERVDTIVNGIVESSNVVRPGQDKIITGSRGEEFVFTRAKYESMYITEEDGTVTPRERFVVAMQNPYNQPIRIEAPWSAPENPQTQDGTAEAMLTFGLDDDGNLTSDRYIIGDIDMLLANYDPAEKVDTPETE